MPRTAAVNPLMGTGPQGPAPLTLGPVSPRGASPAYFSPRYSGPSGATNSMREARRRAKALGHKLGPGEKGLFPQFAYCERCGLSVYFDNPTYIAGRALRERCPKEVQDA